MSKKQFFTLFFCSLAIWMAGNGPVSLLPVYALKLGAEPCVTGYYMSFTFLALAIGTLVAARAAR